VQQAVVGREIAVPIICRFHGIVVRMYYNDHNPPHFHASSGQDEALIEIDSSAVLAGGLPRRAADLVAQWISLHRQELRDNWDRMRNGQVPAAIDPLP
jgi:hypothetical protein